MKKGYEGITITLWKLFTAWALIAIAKFLF